MTNRELIDHLIKLPMDSVAACVYLRHSEYAILEAEDIHYYPAESTGVRDTYECKHRYVLHNGLIMEYDEKTWDQSETPQFVAVIAFPGN